MQAPWCRVTHDDHGTAFKVECSDGTVRCFGAEERALLFAEVRIGAPLEARTDFLTRDIYWYGEGVIR